VDGGRVSGLVDVEWSGRSRRGGQELTSSKPLLATILILFGIGYTIDYNSMSPQPASSSLADLALLPLKMSPAYRLPLLFLNYHFNQQCTSNTTRTVLIRVYGDKCISMNWIVAWTILTVAGHGTNSQDWIGRLSNIDFRDVCSPGNNVMCLSPIACDPSNK
jgi:hypothetical protein